MPIRVATAVRVVVAILLTASVAGPLAAQAPLWTWTNQYGSVLTVTQFNSGNGQINGTYTNNAAGSCDIGQPQPMNGYLAQGNTGTAITFAVNFQGCDSTAVWTGPLNNNSGFQALWLLTLAGPVKWNSIAAGADTFTFQSGDAKKLRK
jgi:hypothetical protein